MPLPTRRKRSSFGGKEGVWWRRKRCAPPSTSAVAPCQDNTTTPSLPDRTTITTSVVEWDEDLARPVYRGRVLCDNQVTSSSSEDSSGEGDDSPSNGLPQKERLAAKRVQLCNFEGNSNRLRVRRTKTFGGRSRRPLSLLLFQDNLSSLSNPCSFSSKPPDDAALVPTFEVLQAIDDPRVDPQRGDRRSTGTVSETHTRAHQTRKLVDADNSKDVFEAWADCHQTLSNSSISTSSEPNPFQFSCLEEASAPPGRTATPATPVRPTATSSVEEAKLYFDHLDASCRLHFDSSVSPRGPRRCVIRTTRKIPLSSPGFVDEYSKYAAASREMGISPLGPVVYAKCRREFFRKAELFDGFVDS